MKHRKNAFFQSLISLLLCLSMLVGTTFAWFTDSVTTGINTIAAGNLDVELYHSNAAVTDERVDPATKLFMDLQGKSILWEPGVVSYENLRVANEGDLALAYQLAISTANENFIVDPSGAQYGLSQILKVGVVEGGITATDRAGVVASVDTANWTTLANFLRSGSLLPEGAGTSEEVWGVVIYWQPGENDNYWNLNNGKTLSSGEVLSIDLGVKLIATQETYESDAFGSDYDTGAKAAVFPNFVGGSASATVVPNAQNQTSAEVTMSAGAVSATVPAGVQLADGVTRLTLNVSMMGASGANITLGENEDMRSLDVHIEGVAANNTTPITVKLTEVAPVGLNLGNYKLYHVEESGTKEMSLVDASAAFSAHNQFKYDPATGDIALYMATFSEVAVVADLENAWKGTVATAFAGGNGIADDPYIIANADQLAYLGDRVSNDNDNYGSAYYKLIADINIGGIENYNTNGRKVLFYPIGYNKVGGTTTDKGNWYTYGGAFRGTFDGTGHTISGIYQNTWAMVGDYSGTYYNDAMGLFGYVYGGTVKNLTIDNFYSEGEFAPTGCVAAYAAGNVTFENIAITNSHPQTYNTGVAGIVGWDEGDVSSYTFRNITVDSSNTISALWGSWDVAAAGLLGYLGKNSKANFENCNVSATIDVYNDVCGNYQYYWYRYCGAYIGTVDKRLDNGKGALDLSNVTATNCTVNFGDRHEYYYCEFVENTKASYTHDYQMSRVDLADIVGSGESATCQDHNHEEHGYETVNGESVLVEDKQAVYLPFRQLFGGYGWGVDGVDLDEYDNIEISDVTEAQEKFKTKFTGDFLYRVGTQNAVNVGSLFAVKDGVTINDSGVYVTITSQHNDNVIMGSFAAPTSDANKDGVKDWKDGQIKFDKTGVVKVTIQDYNYCTPTDLYLEVVDAKNITSVASSTSTDIVLLNDIKVSSNGNANYQNCTVYGNGFTFDVSGGMNQYDSKQGHGIIIAKDATLDHLRIVGDVYDEYGMYTTGLTGNAQSDYTSAVDATNCIIQNCYIANCAAPIRSSGNTITNTTLYGGTVANLLISGGTNVLTNVTTVNYNDGRGVIGMGIVITDGASDSTKLILEGYLKQHNFVSETDISVIKVDEAKTVFNSLFDSQFSAYHIGTNPKYVNTGIVSINDSIDLDNTHFVDNANTGYAIKNDATITISAQGINTSVNAAVASTPSGGTVNNGYADDDNSQGDYLPTFTFALGDQMLAKDSEDDTRYLIGDKDGLEAMYPAGESALTLDLTKLATVTKYTDVSYPVTAKCINPDGTEQVGKVTLATKGTYTLVFTVEDNVFYDQNGNKLNKSVTRTYEVPLVLSVYEKSVADATITISSTALEGEYVNSGSNKKYKMYPLKAITSIMDDANKDGTLETFNFKSNIQSAVLTPEGNNAFSSATTITVTYTGGQVLTIVLGTPSGLNSPGASNGGKTFSVYTDSTNGIYLQSDGAVASSSAVAGTWPLTFWSFKGTSGKVVTDSTQVTINFTKPSTCVTGDTLITLANGAQKRIDQVTYKDQLLVWDFDKGEYAVANSSIIENHGYGYNKLIKLTFEDGTTIKVVNAHGFFDAGLSKWVDINAENASAFIGHSFTQVDGNSYKTVKLLSATVTTKYVEAWSILTANNYNCILEGMFTVTPPATEQLAFFTIGKDMKYDAKAKRADIEKYGLYTYDEFAHLMTYEAFDAFNVAEIKIAVGKGLITYKEVLGLIATYA